MDQIEQNVMGWLLSTILGSGIVLTCAWWALRGRLSEVFQTKAEAAERRKVHDGDVKRIEAKMEGVREVSDRTASRVEVLSTQMQGEKDRLTDVSDRLRNMDTKVDAIASSQAATTEALKGLGHSLDQLRDEIRRRA